MQETRVRPLGQEGSLEKGMTINSSILAGESHREAWWATVHGAAQSQT